MSREEAIDQLKINHIDIYLRAGDNKCPDPATWVDGHFCACPPNMYFAYGYFIDETTNTKSFQEKCFDLPRTFDRDNLKLDIEFTYNGNPYTQHQALVTFKQCTSERIDEIHDYVYGYMTPDEQYCVPECKGIYAPTKDGSKICRCA